MHLINFVVMLDVLCHFVKYFISHLLQNYDTSESKLRREMELYGPIKRVSDTVFAFHVVLKYSIIFIMLTDVSAKPLGM